MLQAEGMLPEGIPSWSSQPSKSLSHCTAGAEDLQELRRHPFFEGEGSSPSSQDLVHRQECAAAMFLCCGSYWQQCLRASCLTVSVPSVTLLLQMPAGQLLLAAAGPDSGPLLLAGRMDLSLRELVCKQPAPEWCQLSLTNSRSLEDCDWEQAHSAVAQAALQWLHQRSTTRAAGIDWEQAHNSGPGSPAVAATRTSAPPLVLQGLTGSRRTVQWPRQPCCGCTRHQRSIAPSLVLQGLTGSRCAGSRHPSFWCLWPRQPQRRPWTGS